MSTKDSFLIKGHSHQMKSDQTVRGTYDETIVTGQLMLVAHQLLVQGA